MTESIAGLLLKWLQEHYAGGASAPLSGEVDQATTIILHGEGETVTGTIRRVERFDFRASAPEPTPTSPAAPGGLTAMSAFAGQVDLAWTDNSDDEDGFRLERSGDGAAWAVIADLPADSATYSDMDLLAGTYYYRILAYNEAGPSAYSNTAAAVQAGGRAFFAAPDGGATGAGSFAEPWDPDTAFAGGNPAGTLQPGDTLYLLGGVYGEGLDDVFVIPAAVSGAEGSPITVKPWPGAHAAIDGGFSVYGSFIRLVGLEIFNSRWPERYQPRNAGPQSVAVYDRGYGNEYINLVIHDTGSGIASQREGRAARVYGCLIYNVGYQASDQNVGTGEAFYLQNTDLATWKRIENTIMADNFMGLQLYGEAASVYNFEFNGLTSLYGRAFAVGGADPAQTVHRFVDCDFWNKYGLHMDGAGERARVDVIGCRIASRPEDDLWAWMYPRARAGTVSGNRVVSGDADVPLYYFRANGNTYPQEWDGNAYYAGAGGTVTVRNYTFAGSSWSFQSFSGWQAASGYDAGSTAAGGRPTANEVIVRPNAEERGRGHIIIYNWQGLDSAAVDLSSLGLLDGERVELRSAQDYYNVTGRAAPIAVVYQAGVPAQSSAVPVDMRAERWDYARPTGASDAERAAWGSDDWGALTRLSFPDLGVFVVVKI